MANLVAFDPAKMHKNGCLIVTVATMVRDKNGNLITIVVCNAVLNKGSPITLCSEFQTQESGVSINLVTTQHCQVDREKGTQSIYLHANNNTVIPMKVQAALFCFQHWSSNENETFPIQYMTNIGPWEPQQFYDANDSLGPVISPVSIMYHTTSSSPAIEASMINEGSSVDATFMTRVTQTMGTNSPWSTTPSEPPNEPKFMTSDTLTNEEEEPYFFDPSDNMSERNRQGWAFYSSTNLNKFFHMAKVDRFLDDIKDDELLGFYKPFNMLAFSMQARATIPEAKKLQPFLAWCPLEVIWCTLENTTQLAQVCHDCILQNHMKPWFPWLNWNHLHKTVATNTMFSLVQDLSGRTCVQV